MTTTFHTNFWAMIHDIRDHAKNNGRAIIYAGEGKNTHFKCVRTGKIWQCSNPIFVDPKTPEEKQLLKMASSSEDNFLTMLNSKGLEHLL